MEALIIIKTKPISKAHKIDSNEIKSAAETFFPAALFYFVKLLFIAISLKTILYNLLSVDKYQFRLAHNFHWMIVPHNHVGIFAHSKAP